MLQLLILITTAVYPLLAGLTRQFSAKHLVKLLIVLILFFIYDFLFSIDISFRGAWANWFYVSMHYGLVLMILAGLIAKFRNNILRTIFVIVFILMIFMSLPVAFGYYVLGNDTLPVKTEIVYHGDTQLKICYYYSSGFVGSMTSILHISAYQMYDWLPFERKIGSIYFEIFHGDIQQYKVSIQDNKIFFLNGPCELEPIPLP